MATKEQFSRLIAERNRLSAQLERLANQLEGLNRAINIMDPEQQDMFNTIPPAGFDTAEAAAEIKRRAAQQEDDRRKLRESLYPPQQVHGGQYPRTPQDMHDLIAAQARFANNAQRPSEDDRRA